MILGCAPSNTRKLSGGTFFIDWCILCNAAMSPEIYTLSLHDALPILSKHLAHNLGNLLLLGKIGVFKQQQVSRSEERFSRNAETDLVCRLLLEKKKKNKSNTITQHDIRSRRVTLTQW